MISGIGRLDSSILRLMIKVSTLYASGPGWPNRLLWLTSHWISTSPSSFSSRISMAMLPRLESRWTGKRDRAVSTLMTFSGNSSVCVSGFLGVGIEGIGLLPREQQQHRIFVVVVFN